MRSLQPEGPFGRIVKWHKLSNDIPIIEQTKAEAKHFFVADCTPACELLMKPELSSALWYSILVRSEIVRANSD